MTSTRFNAGKTCNKMPMSSGSISAASSWGIERRYVPSASIKLSNALNGIDSRS